MPHNQVLWQIIAFWDANLQTRGTFFAHVYGALRARTHCQKGTQICNPLANKCPKFLRKNHEPRDIFLQEGHIFVSLFDHVYGPLTLLDISDEEMNVMHTLTSTKHTVNALFLQLNTLPTS